MNNIFKVLSCFLLLLAVVSMQSCVDTDFDEPINRLEIPDSKVLPMADLLEFFPPSGQSIELTDELLGSDELYVAGVLTSDDTEGNFFKAIYFQDSTDALVIEPDQNELNAAYPVNSIVYVRLNGLYLLNDSGVPKLAYAVDGSRSVRMPDAVVRDFIFAGGNVDVSLVPEAIALSDLLSNPANYYNKLVSISGVELTSEFLGATYAITDGPDGPESVNVFLQDCEPATDDIILRNSGFSSFAGQTMPLGNGTIVAVVNRFGSDLQLFIRDTNDLNFDGDRCDGTVVSGEFPDNELDLAVIKENFLTLGVDKIDEGFIEGVVISEDNITNRNLVLQTSTAGVILRFSNSHNYELGEKLKVNVSGYSIGEFNGGTQIDGISPLAIREEGTAPLPEPVEVTVGEMLEDIYTYESVRVKLTGATLGGNTYTGNIDIADGTGTITTFIQNFASFSGQPAPSGSVDIIGYGSYYNREQIIFNSPSDVTGGSTTGGNFPDNELDIGELRSNFLDQGIDAIPEGFIQGTVISADNITNRNLVLQNGEDGIIVRFASAHTYALGQQLRVNVSGLAVSEFNGGTQIDGVSAAQVREEGSQSLPDPIDVTVADLLSDIYRHESVRVKLSGVTLSSSSYTGNIDIADGTGTISTFIQNFASFSGQPAPSGSVDIVGYGSYYNREQIIFNSPSDVTGDGGGGNPGSNGAVSKDFEGETDFEPINYAGWLNVTLKGNEPWYFRSFDDNGFAECEAFMSESAEVETWLITPTIDTDDKSIMSFETAQAFWKHQGLSVWVSPDFTDVADADWTELTAARIADDSDPQYDFIPSGDVDLKAVLSGKVRVGWRYQGTSAANTTKMRIDNVVLK